MKNVCLKIGLIALALALVFGVALIVLAVNREYAKLHYSQHVTEYSFGYEVGCGKGDCKYCNGQKATYSGMLYSTSTDKYGKVAPCYHQFLYFRLVTGFWIACIVLTAVSGATAAVTIPLHFARKRQR